MLTDNMNVFDSLIIGSIGTVKHLDMRSNSLCSTIYVKFDDPKTGNSMKDRRLRNQLKEYLPITARTKKFPLKKGAKSLSLLKENNSHGYLIMQLLSTSPEEVP